jgi:ABC-type Na+ efflux pump permease subunit
MNITFYQPGTNEVIANEFTSGDVSFQIYSPKADLELNFDDNLIILLQNFRVSDMSKKIVVNYMAPYVEGYNTLNGYLIQLPDFNFDNAVLKMKYPGVSEVQNNVKLLKCSDFDFTSYECSGNWTSIPITIDVNEESVTANVKSFSVYTLVEAEGNETTLTTTQTLSTSQATSIPPVSSTTQTSSPASGLPPQTNQQTTTTTSIITTSQPTLSTATTPGEMNKSSEIPSKGFDYISGMFSLVSKPVLIVAILALIGLVVYVWYSGNINKNNFRFNKHRNIKKKSEQKTNLKLD